MINIKDFIDNIFFIMFKRYIFKNNKKNDYFELFPETFKNETETENENETDDNNDEVLFLRNLKE